MRKHFYELATLAELRILREGFQRVRVFVSKGASFLKLKSEINNFLARYCSILC